MKHLITEYINAQSNRWATSTIKSEHSRLNAMAHVLNGDPLTLWNGLQSMGAYARKTAFIRAGSFWEWAHKSAVYKDWMKDNQRLFTNAYTKERLDISYDEAVLAIESIEDTAIKKRAQEILMGAVRYCESTQPVSDTVIGKGGKIRPDFRQPVTGPAYTGSYLTFWRALKKVGLKPHTLRKLALTRMAERGASLFDLMEVAGWSTPQTAASYIQPSKTEKLKKMLA